MRFSELIAVSLQAREIATGSFILGKDVSVMFAPNASVKSGFWYW